MLFGSSPKSVLNAFRLQVARQADKSAETQKELDKKTQEARQRLVEHGAREEVLDEWEELAFQATHTPHLHQPPLISGYT